MGVEVGDGEGLTGERGGGGPGMGRAGRGGLLGKGHGGERRVRQDERKENWEI